MKTAKERREYQRNYYKNNAEKFKKYAKKWKEKNPEKAKEINRNGFAKHYKKNHAKIRKYHNEYYAKRRDAARTPEEKIALEYKRALSKLPKKVKEKLVTTVNSIKAKQRYLNLSKSQKKALLIKRRVHYNTKYHSDPEFREKRLEYLAQWRAKNRKSRSTVTTESRH